MRRMIETAVLPYYIKMGYTEFVVCRKCCFQECHKINFIKLYKF